MNSRELLKEMSEQQGSLCTVKLSLASGRRGNSTAAVTKPWLLRLLLRLRS